jgi:molybdopterin converting factor small subunit
VEVRVRVPAALVETTGGARAVAVAVDGDPVTVAAVLDAVAERHPALARRVRDELGRTRIHVNLFVGPDNVRDRDGLDTVVGPGEEVSIIAAVSGG